MTASRTATLIGLLALGGLLNACGGGNGEVTSDVTTEVEIDGIAFVPAELEVDAGAEVTWVNRDDVEHTVTSGRQAEQGVPGVSDGKDAKPDGTFDGDLEEEDSSFSFTFDEPGTYAYYCEIHVGMVGKIVVN